MEYYKLYKLLDGNLEACIQRFASPTYTASTYDTIIQLTEDPIDFESFLASLVSSVTSDEPITVESAQAILRTAIRELGEQLIRESETIR